VAILSGYVTTWVGLHSTQTKILGLQCVFDRTEVGPYAAIAASAIIRFTVFI